MAKVTITIEDIEVPWANDDRKVGCGVSVVCDSEEETPAKKYAFMMLEAGAREVNADVREVTDHGQPVI